MPPPSPSRAAALRSCVVNAVRESEALMARLVQATTDALGQQEQDPRSSARRDAAGDARRLLDRHGPALVRGYPMALLEICAEPAARSSASLPPVQGGPSSVRLNTPSNTGTLTHFGPQGLSELTLLGEEEVQAQVEMSRAQQQAVHANDAVLAELDTLMSAAQGLDYVQPERNPLRPYSYLRALQQVVSETGVALPVRESWMQILCSLLGGELTDIYQQSVQALRSAGIAPVGYARGGGGGSSRRGSGAGFGSGYASASGAAPGGRSRQAAGYGGEARISQHHSGGHSVYLSSDYDSPPLNAQAEEAMLTVSMLRQMLAQETGFSAAGISTLQGGGQSWERNPAQRGRIYRPGTSRAELEALEDMEVLEQLVTRLSQDSDMLALGDGAPHSRGHRTHSSTFRGSDTSMQAMPSGTASRAAEIVARMVETMVEEGGLLPPVQRAIQNLEPAVRQLVRHDTRFFNDSLHPARCLLDEITERSLAFSSVHAPGFDSFMQLVDEAVRYLSSLAITNAQPFDIVLAALQAAWQTQEKKRHAAQQQALAPVPVPAPVPPLVPVPAMPRPEASSAPQPQPQPQQDPGQQVHAAHQQQQAAGQHPERNAPEDSTNAAWQEQPQQPSTTETVQAADTAATLPAEEAPPQAAPETSAAVHEAVPEPESTPEPSPEASAASAASAISASPAFDDVHWVLGVWVEMESAGRSLRTQLTWVSPQQTLFMFTGPDGSTQSMTRRVRDKLAGTGALRIVPAGAPAGKSASAGPAPQSRTALPPGRPTRR